MKTIARRFVIFLGFSLFVLATVLMSCRGAITRPIIFPAPNFKLTPELPEGQVIKVAGTRTAFGYYAKGGKGLVVFFHGNGEVMGSMQSEAAFMQREGFSVLMAEYPGYGYAAAYKATEENIYADAEALIRYVHKNFGHESKDTILWGFSLGTGVAVEMAVRALGERLILMAPLTSAKDAAEHHFFFAARWLVVDDFDTKSKARKITYPTLIVHGERDAVIPFAMGKELAGIFPNSKFMPVSGADHNDLHNFLGPKDWRKIRAFAAGQTQP